MYNMKSKSNRNVDYLRFIIVYLQRWGLTNISYLVFNIVSSSLVFLVSCYAVRDGAFDGMETTKSCLFAVLMCCIWSGLFNSIALFYSESDYTMDDLSKVLPVRVYLISNVLIQAFLCAIEAIISVTIFCMMFEYEVADIVTSNINLDYGITFFLILFSADMLGFALGVLVKDIKVAMTIIPFVLIAQFLFSGCLFELSGVLETVSQYTSAKWGFSALGSLADLNNMTSNFEKLCVQYSIPYEKTANELFDSTSSFVVECWEHLLILSVIAMAVAAILLYFKLNDSEESFLSRFL